MRDISDISAGGAGALQIIPTSDMSLQVCHCGWSNVTTYQGLRIHQGKMGCTPKGMAIPKTEQFRFNNYIPRVTLMEPPNKVEKPLVDIFSSFNMLGSDQNIFSRLLEDSRQIDSSPINITPVKMEPFVMSVSQTLSLQPNPTADESNKLWFESPQQLRGVAHQTTTSARRALDFSTGAQQVGQLPWDLPTFTAPQETVVRPKESQVEKEREVQRLLKASQDKIKADLQQEVRMREQKIDEVRSSVKACNGRLDAEWVEIDNVFSEVARIMEGARQKALQPLQERKHRLETEAQDLLMKLQKEIYKLKNAIDEVDRNPDFQGPPPLKGLDESKDWKKVIADSSSGLGTLRSKTSNMMKQIHQRLEKLSSVEIKRIPEFAVDVTMDPTTAHQCLALSPDLKRVSDGGNNQNLPDTPERFNMYGSILGLNRLTSGRSYWEVEVSNKTGWDLGVARRNANRKGMLKLTPDNGYWVTVHYEGEKYAALSAPPVSLSLKDKPKKVGVFVDYEEGLVSFYDVMAQSHIYSFTECKFHDEIFPYFSPHLEHNGKNSSPLVISAVMKQGQLCM